MITDRTEMDALLENEKGIYTYTDLNRVESAVSQISNQLPALGFSLQLQTKTDWNLTNAFSVLNWPTESQMKRYLQNVSDIKRIFLIPTQIPSAMENLNWVGANNIEKVLESAFERIAGIKQSYRYSGEIFAGEE